MARQVQASVIGRKMRLKNVRRAPASGGELLALKKRENSILIRSKRADGRLLKAKPTFCARCTDHVNQIAVRLGSGPPIVPQLHSI